MLVYDNGKMSVLAATRCGHTSMYRYFKIKPYSLKESLVHLWLESKSQKVLVLRNPYDRLQSALCHNARLKYATPDEKAESLHIHSSPFLHMIPKTTDFKIIDFYRLSEYIRLSGDTFVSNSNNVSSDELDITPEMRQEYSDYLYFKKYCPEITPEEWRELTS